MSKAKKIAKRQAFKALAEKHGFDIKLVDQMKEYLAQKPCGCCDEVLYFRNDEEASEAFRKVGFTHGEVVDSLGIKHESIDTFYGIQRADKKTGRGLSYLVDLIGGKKSWP